MSEVKIYRVTGLALFGHDKYPEWRKFSIEVRALRPEHVLEHVYSVLGGRHKLKRKNIKILSIEEIPVDKVSDRLIKEIMRHEVIEIVGRQV